MAVGGILILTVGRIHEHYGFLRPLRPAMLCTLIALGMAFMLPRALAPGGLFRTWTPKVMLGITALACISAPFGLSLGASGAFLLNVYSRVLIFAFLLVLAIRNAGDLRFFIWMYLVSAAFVCYLAIFVLDLKQAYGTHVARLDAEGGMYDANDIGVILTIAIPLALLVFQTSRWRGKVFAALLLLGIAWTIALSGSRGAFIGLVAIGLVLLVRLNHVSLVKRLAFVIVLGGGLAYAAPEGYWKQMETMLHPKDDYNLSADDGRVKVWKRGIGYMLSYPLTGLGVANFGRAEGTISEKAKHHERGTGLMFTAAHNSFVQAGAELGIGGLVLFCALVFGGMRSIKRLGRRMPRAWASGDDEQRFLVMSARYLPLTLISFAVTGFFVSFAYASTPYLLAAFVSGLIVATERRLAQDALASGAAPAPAASTRGPGFRSARTLVASPTPAGR